MESREETDKKLKRPPSWWLRVTSFKRSSLALPNNSKLSDSPLGRDDRNSSRHHRSNTTMGSEEYSSDSSDIYGFPPIIPKRSSSLLDTSSGIIPSSRQSMVTSSDCSADWLPVTQDQFTNDRVMISPNEEKEVHRLYQKNEKARYALERNGRRSVGGVRRESPEDIPPPLPPRNASTSLKNISRQPLIEYPSSNGHHGLNMSATSSSELLADREGACDGSNASIASGSGGGVGLASFNGSPSSIPLIRPNHLSLNTSYSPIESPHFVNSSTVKVEAATQTSRTLEKKRKSVRSGKHNNVVSNKSTSDTTSTSQSHKSINHITNDIQEAQSAIIHATPVKISSSRRSSQTSTPLSFSTLQSNCYTIVNGSNIKCSDTNESSVESPHPVSPPSPSSPQSKTPSTASDFGDQVSKECTNLTLDACGQDEWYTAGSSYDTYGGMAGYDFTDLSLNSDMTNEEVIAKLHWKMDMIRADEVELSARIAHFITGLSSRGLTPTQCDKLRTHAVEMEQVTKLTLLLSNRLFSVERDLKSDLTISTPQRHVAHSQAVPSPQLGSATQATCKDQQASANNLTLNDLNDTQQVHPSPDSNCTDSEQQIDSIPPFPPPPIPFSGDQLTPAARQASLSTKKSKILLQLSDADSLRKWIHGRGRRLHAHIASRMGNTQADEYSALLKARARLVVERQDILERIQLTERHVRLDAFAYLQ